MKKLFTFAAAVLASVAMMAQTENVGTYSTQVISPDATTSTWTFILPSSQVTVPTGETEDNGIIYAPSGSSKMKFSNSNQFSWQGESSGYIPVPSDAAGTITMTVKGSSDSRWLQLYVNGAAADDSKRLWSKYAEAAGDGKKGPQSFAFTSADLTTKNGKKYLHFKDNNKEMKIASFEIVLTSGQYGEPSTDPIAYVTKETLDLKINRSGLEQKQDSFELKGMNLPNDAAANITIPNHAGLSISPTSFSIVDGSIDQKFIVTYAPLAENDEFNGNILITAGSFELQVALECNKLAPQAELVAVNGDIVWDWNNAAPANIAPADANLEYIFANTSDDWAESFPADKIAGKAQYFYYKGNNCFQGPILKFVTTVAGKLVIEFSNTGGDRPYRHIFLNGVDTGEKSNSATKVTSDELAVEAGEVLIEGMMENTEAEGGFSSNQLRIYKITFTKSATTAIDNTKAEVKAVKRVINGQLFIEKAGVLYNAQGAVVK